MKRIFLQKAKNQIARPNTIRDINKRIVLNYVRERSPISRAEIARQTELQRSTVSAIVDELQNSGLIEETGIGSSTGGRKPTLLRLKTCVPAAIGVDVNPRRTTIALADLAGTVLDKEDFTTSPDEEFMSEQILNRVNRFTQKCKNPDIGIGISIPGIADQNRGKTIYIPYFQWRSWDIVKQLSQKTGLSVTIDNDANAIALAELWFGRGTVRKISNFITVLVGEGIGTGIIFDGQVYRGEKGAAGEFGHMIVGEKGPVKCSCGSRDCWEAYASENAILARYHQNFTQNFQNNPINMQQLLSLAEEGENQAIKALKETAQFLGIGISNLIVGLSPQAIIVSGSITRVWEIIRDEIQQITDRSVRRDLPTPNVMASTLGENPTLIGALSLVLAKKFASAVKS